MYQRKTPVIRKNHFLTSEDKAEIIKFIRANQSLTNTKIGDRFNVSRGTISTLRKATKK